MNHVLNLYSLPFAIYKTLFPDNEEEETMTVKISDALIEELVKGCKTAGSPSYSEESLL